MHNIHFPFVDIYCDSTLRGSFVKIHCYGFRLPLLCSVNIYQRLLGIRGFFFHFLRAAGCFDVGNRPKPLVTFTRNCARNVSAVRDIQSSSWLSNISLKLNDQYVPTPENKQIRYHESNTRKSFSYGIQITLTSFWILDCASYFSTHLSFSECFLKPSCLIHCMPHCSVRYVTGWYTDPRWPGLCK